MIDILICIVLVLCTFVCAYFFYKEQKVKKSSISFKESLDLANVPLITFTTAKGTKLNFILDTGCAVSTIDPRFIEGETYTEVKDCTHESVGVEGIVRESNIIAMELGYKESKYLAVFCLQDLQSSMDYLKSYSGVTAHGLIGSDFFQRYKYVLDFKEMIAYAKRQICS